MCKLINFAAFQACWFACILGAAAGQPWLGPVVVACWLISHLRWSVDKMSMRIEILLIFLAAILGYALDSCLMLTGFISFPTLTALGWPSPIWMVALWMAFAATLNSSMSWLRGRYVIGAVAGALFAPMAYRAGAYFNAIELEHGIYSLLAVAFLWASAMVVLLFLQARLSMLETLTERYGLHEKAQG